MEITFHFESSVIPFIGRIAPSDTYRIWKRGSNLRADMTLAGFDGFRIRRSDQTLLFLGEGYSSEDGNASLAPGSLIVLAHKKKEITNALEGAGAQPTEAEVAHEVMSQTNMYRPGIDVTQADERIANGGDNDDYEDVLIAEEMMQLDSALRIGNSDGVCEDENHHVHDSQEHGSGGSFENCESNGIVKERKSWFGWNKKGSKNGSDDPEDSKILKKFSKLALESSSQRTVDSQKSSFEFSREDMGEAKKGKDKSNKKKKKKDVSGDSKHESEYKKGLRPVLWLKPDFPLKTEELLPLLDILANKVRAVRRLMELLTTKLPHGTFPVKVLWNTVLNSSFLWYCYSNLFSHMFCPHFFTLASSLDIYQYCGDHLT